MVKFTATIAKTGRTLIGLGVSRENVKRLEQGMPIHVHLEELNLPYAAEVYIFFAETDQQLADLVKPGIGPETKVSNLRAHQ